MQSLPLFSIIVISYKNFKFIHECIDSILSQTYPNIELIVQNDFSNDFSKTELDQYLRENAGSNIANIIISQNEENLGTVKNVNRALKKSSGEFVYLIAEDDVIYDDTIISQFYEYFLALGAGALVITSQVAMYSYDMKEELELYLDEDKKQKIMHSTPKEMFHQLVREYTIPATGTCYRRSFYTICGFYDEEYMLIEDAPMFIKMSRLGVRAYYLDIISAKHRDGGVSHGNVSKDRNATKKYLQDTVLFCEKELLKYKDVLSEEEKKIVQEKYDYSVSALLAHDLPEQTVSEKVMTIAKPAFFKRAIKIAFEWTRKLAFDNEKLFYLGVLSSLFVLILTFVDFSRFVNTGIAKILEYSLSVVAIIGLFLFLFFLLFGVIYRGYKVFRKIVKKFFLR